MQNDTLEHNDSDQLDDALNPAHNTHASGGHDALPASKQVSADEMMDMERSFAAPAASNRNGVPIEAKQLTAKEKSPDDEIPYTPEGKNGKRKGWWNKKRAGIAGGIAGIGIGGGLFGLSFLAGPAGIIHLAEALRNPFSKTQSDQNASKSHWTRELRALRNNNTQYTRVGYFGAKMADKFLGKLADSGITVDKVDAAGRTASYNIDKAKYAKAQGITEAEVDNNLKEKYGSAYKGGKLDVINLKNKDFNGFQGKLLDDAGYKGASKFFNLRNLKVFNGSRTLLSASSALEDKARSKLTGGNNASTSTESDSSPPNAPDENLAAPEAAKATSAVQAVEDSKSGFVSSLSSWVGFGGGTLYGLGCTTIGASKAITTIDRYAVALPSIIEATRIAEFAGEIKAGHASPEAIGTVVNSFTATSKTDTDNSTPGHKIKDAGTNIWDGGALQVLAGETSPDKNGEVANDITADRQGAFSPPDTSTIKAIGEGMRQAGIGATTGGAADLIPGSDCNPAESGAVLVGGFIETAVATAITFGAAAPAEAGADVAANAGVKVALQSGIKTMLEKYASTTAAKQLVTVKGAKAALYTGTKFIGTGLGMAAGMKAIEDLIINSNAIKALPADAFTGAQGGNLLAYGARASANLVSASSGGVILADSTAKTLLGSAGAEDQQAFEHESMFARVFDVNDYRSLAGHLSMDISPSVSANIYHLSTGFLHVGSSLQNSFGSVVSGSTFADSADNSYTGNYDWGFPQFGIPDQVMNADNDPLDNAERLGKWLTENCGTSGGSDCNGVDYKSRVLACFGNNLTQTDGKWDVAPAPGTPDNPTDIDWGTDGYKDADCGNLSDPVWTQMMSFVNDMGTLKTMACIAGTSDQACTDMGAGSNDGSATPTDTGVPSGDAATLAKQVLANPNITLGPGAKPDVVAASNNQKVTPGPIADGGAGTKPCSARTPVYISPQLLQAMLAIAQKYKYQIQDITSDHNCDTGRHPLGRAMDIFQLNGVPLSGHWQDKSVLDFAAGTADIMSKLLPNGKFTNGSPVNMAGIGVCSQGDIPSPPSNVNYFVDACDELHVDVGVAQ